MSNVTETPTDAPSLAAPASCTRFKNWEKNTARPQEPPSSGPTSSALTPLPRETSLLRCTLLRVTAHFGDRSVSHSCLQRFDGGARRSVRQIDRILLQYMQRTIGNERETDEVSRHHV